MQLTLDPETQQSLDALAEGLLARQWTVTAAESCTGGAVAAALTSLAGCSRWFEVGYVTYSNRIKNRQLGVPQELLNAHGAVSEPVALAMVDGALATSGAQLAVAVSGIAGPDGGSAEKPVGTVWFAWGLASGERLAECRQFSGDRAEVRALSVAHAIQGLVELLPGNH